MPSPLKSLLRLFNGKQSPVRSIDVQGVSPKIIPFWADGALSLPATYAWSSNVGDLDDKGNRAYSLTQIEAADVFTDVLQEQYPRPAGQRPFPDTWPDGQLYSLPSAAVPSFYASQGSVINRPLCVRIVFCNLEDPLSFSNTGNNSPGEKTPAFEDETTYNEERFSVEVQSSGYYSFRDPLGDGMVSQNLPLPATELVYIKLPFGPAVNIQNTPDPSEFPPATSGVFPPSSIDTSAFDGPTTAAVQTAIAQLNLILPQLVDGPFEVVSITSGTISSNSIITTVLYQDKPTPAVTSGGADTDATVDLKLQEGTFRFLDPSPAAAFRGVAEMENTISGIVDGLDLFFPGVCFQKIFCGNSAAATFIANSRMMLNGTTPVVPGSASGVFTGIKQVQLNDVLSASWNFGGGREPFFCGSVLDIVIVRRTNDSVSIGLPDKISATRTLQKSPYADYETILFADTTEVPCGSYITAEDVATWEDTELEIITEVELEAISKPYDIGPDLQALAAASDAAVGVSYGGTLEQSTMYDTLAPIIAAFVQRVTGNAQ